MKEIVNESNKFYLKTPSNNFYAEAVYSNDELTVLKGSVASSELRNYTKLLNLQSKLITEQIFVLKKVNIFL